MTDPTSLWGRENEGYSGAITRTVLPEPGLLLVVSSAGETLASYDGGQHFAAQVPCHIVTLEPGDPFPEPISVWRELRRNLQA